MTRLRDRKTRLRFETDVLVQGRELMVEVTPETVVLRQKGRQARFELSWETIYREAAARYAARQAELRKLRRKRTRSAAEMERMANLEKWIKGNR